MKHTIFVVLCLVLTFSSFAQKIGQNPSSLNWQVIYSHAGSVIFPKGMSTQAQRITNMINLQSDSLSQSVGSKLKKINIVIQNQTVIPNGYVGLAPFRSEFYSTPFENMQALGSTDWLDQLTIHEYRHVKQFTNTKYGLTKVFYYLQGEFGWSFWSNLSIPAWYFEGDAVITETALTNGGRGRTPTFTAQQRALSLANINYNYTKSRNGSFKDDVPNRYPLGYMMLTHLRNEKGNNIMVPILRDASAYKGVFYPFSRAVKKHAGFTTTSLYKASWENAKRKWQDDLNKAKLKPTEPVTWMNEKTVTNYFFPQGSNNGGVYAMKNSYKTTERIVKIENGKERVITSVGMNIRQYFNYRNDHFVWTETSKNPRRNNINYSDIIYYDIKKSKRIKITDSEKYFSPVLSADNESVIAIHITPNQISSLKRIDVQTQEVTELVTFKLDEFVVRPNFTDQDESLVYIMRKKSKLAIFRYDLKSKNIVQLTPWTAHVMDSPRAKGGYVYYTAAYSGIDNIYRVPLDGTKMIEQITSVSVGAYQASLSSDGKTLFFTEHTRKGKVISKMNLGDGSQNLILNKIIEPVDMQWQDKVATKAEGGNILDNIPETEHEITDYKGVFKGLKLHSWSFVPFTAAPSIFIRMNNYLNDVSVLVGGGYNNNENGAFYNAKLVYAKWYPVITLSVDMKNRSAIYLNSINNLKSQDFDESIIGLDISLPHNWSEGNYNTSFTPRVGIFYRNITDRINNDKFSLPNAFFNSMSAGFEFYWLRRRAYQNVDSRLGLYISLEYKRNIENNDNQRFVNITRVYLPGIFANHSLKFTNAYRKELLSNTFQHADVFSYVRGTVAPINDKYLKVSADYELPLFYPDWGFWGLTYFKRVRANLFYDYGWSHVFLIDQETKYNSAGYEIIFDNTYANLLSLSLGIRGSFLIKEDSNNPNDKFVPSFFITVGF